MGRTPGSASFFMEKQAAGRMAAGKKGTAQGAGAVPGRLCRRVIFADQQVCFHIDQVKILLLRVIAIPIATV